MEELPPGVRLRRDRIGFRLAITAAVFLAGLIFLTDAVSELMPLLGQPAVMSEAYRRERDLPGELLPSSVQAGLIACQPVFNGMPNGVRQRVDEITREHAGEVDNPPTLLIAQWRNVMDLPRMTREVELLAAAPDVGGQLRQGWETELADFAIKTPRGNRTEVLDFQWLNPGHDVRVTTVVYGQQTAVCLLYLTRVGDAWKLYDCRDILQPESELFRFARPLDQTFAKASRALPSQSPSSPSQGDEVQLESQPLQRLQRLGWHPELVLQICDLPADPQWSIQWLQRNLTVNPRDEASMVRFLDIAQAEDWSEIVVRLADLPDGIARSRELLEVVQRLAPQRVSEILVAADALPELHLLRRLY